MMSKYEKFQRKDLLQDNIRSKICSNKVKIKKIMKALKIINKFYKI